MVNYFMFGLAGSGKDTAASILVDLGYHPISLADPIRFEYMRFLGRDDFRKNREMMIRIGEGYKKIYGEDVWVRIALDKAMELNDASGVPVVIVDGRYPFEYDYFVAQHKFVPIRIVADEKVRMKRLMQRDGTVQQKSLEFEKEHFIPDYAFAHTVENNGTVEDLEDSLIKLYKNTKRGQAYVR